MFFKATYIVYLVPYPKSFAKNFFLLISLLLINKHLLYYMPSVCVYYLHYNLFQKTRL